MQKALLEIRQLRSQVKALEATQANAATTPTDQKPTEAIAIIGMGCRFPGGATTPAQFWQQLSAGMDAITEVPPDRWNLDDYYDPDPTIAGKIVTCSGGFVDHLHEFDAEFFGISPREARSLDPQQRLLLEVSWEALEQAGIIPQTLMGQPIGVFVGLCSNDYSQQLLTRPVTEIDAYLATGNAHSTAAGRIAYTLGLTGPCLAIDTACSSSLVAVHLACQSLRLEECPIALVGGVNRILSPEFSINFSQARMLAADGRCKTFDSRADGFGRAEGCGVIVLKRLTDAIADRDPILAVIRGSAVNQDGRSSGLTVPNGPAQQAVIRQALSQANCDPAAIGYIEAHGTGTQLGDPIEVGALNAVFGSSHSAEKPLLIGSVKTNIGHLEAAAGIAGLIKVVLSIQQCQIPPHLHVQQPNPHIEWQPTIAIPSHLTDWRPDSGDRLAGVSSFGFSGTNAHVIVSSPPIAATKPEPELGHRPLHLLTLSAKTPTALQPLIQRYCDWLEHHPELEFADLCFSANTGRSQFAHRLSIIAASSLEAHQQLTEALTTELPGSPLESSSPPKLGFLFTGQGSQYGGMAQSLYQTQPTVRQALDRCAQLLQTELDIPLLQLLQPGNEQIHQTCYTQPALFAIEYALVQLWRSWGVQPSVVMGHSLGEYVAACVAGVFSLEDALKLVVTRARLMQQLPSTGGMVAVMATATTAQRIAPDLAIAAINAPDNTVLSGATTEMEPAIAAFQAHGIKTTRLTVSHAFHSALMEPMVSAFAAIARQVSYAPPQIPLVSNLTGEWVGAQITTAEYWCDHLRQMVQFAKGVETLHQLGCTGFVEIGPKPILLGMARSCSPSADYLWLPSLRPGQADWSVMLASLKALSDRGVAIDWVGFDRDYSRQRLPVPTYPFQRQRYWVERAIAQPGLIGHPLLGNLIPIAHQSQRYFSQTLQPHQPAYLADHRVFDQVILPAAAYLEMALAAARQLLLIEQIQLTQVTIQQPLFLNELNQSNDDRTVQLIANPEPADQPTWELVSLTTAETWITHATGSFSRLTDDSSSSPPMLNQMRIDCPDSVDRGFFYEQLYQHGITYGDSFQAIQQLWRGENQALAWIELPVSLSDPAYSIHPIVLDACFQTIGATLLEQPNSPVYLPIGCDRFSLYQSATESVWSAVQVRHRDATRLSVDVWVMTATGATIAAITGLHLKATPALHPTPTPWQNWLYQVEWQAQTLETVPVPSPAAIAHQLSPHFDQLLAAPELQAYAEQLDNLEARSIAYTVQAFSQLGLTWTIGNSVSTSTFATQFGILPNHHQLCDRLLQMLAEVGLLQAIAAPELTWQIVQLPSLRQTQRVSTNNKTVEQQLLDRCGERLADVLRGKYDPLQLLFPNGDRSLLTHLYQDSPGAATTNALVQQAVIQIRDALPTGRSLRILELGAGTGGTTAHLLPLLDPQRTTYGFTDVSPLFLSQAKAKFSAYEFVNYQLLDLERSPITQGFSPHSFDLVIAANVLHATQNLHQTLTHIHQLLATGGAVVLVEGTRPARWLDLIFGLTEGWWRFSDRALRPDYPLISVTQWQQVLADCGFQDSQEILPTLTRPAALTQQAVIVARSSRLIEHWLLLGNSIDPAQAIQTSLQAQGQTATLLSSVNQLSHALDHALRQQNPITQVVDLRCLEIQLDQPETDLEWVVQTLTESSLELVQILIQAAASHSPKLWIVTQGATNNSITLEGLAQSSVWSLGKVVALEHPELGCKRIDLDAASPIVSQVPQLVTELLANPTEDQVALHQGQRSVARLQRDNAIDRRAVPSQPYTLAMPTRGTLEDLHWQPTSRRSPDASEVEIQVQASGLNLIDVLDALNLLPFERDWFGVECAGTVVAIGEGVTQFQVGDAVVALASQSLGEFVTVDARLVVNRPEHLSPAAAATIPANFLTAAYALHSVAKLQPGDRVLIHAAAGGTGMAAVKLAQEAGAEVWATASPAKWEVLRSLGVRHLFNSRTVDFAAEMLQQIDGVDVVFNSLSGDFIPKSLSVLRSGGRFVEIGKREIWTAAQVAQVRPDVDYAIVDLLTLTQERPALIQSLLRDLMHQFESDKLQPLPYQSFAADQVVTAFRTMQQAKHIGKIVIDHPTSPSIRSDATYLITGGFGGLGLAVAQWLVQQGARHLLLVGRSHPSPAAAERVRSLQTQGATISTVQADVSQPDQVAQALAQIDSAHPLGGIIHSAGVLDDGSLTQLTPDRMRQVMAPKVAAAWHLHTLTQHLPLDFFVCFSSAASLLGSPGQGNHVAANGFLDAFAHYRHAQGLPALSINWGAWSEIGSAADPKLATQMQQRGIGTIAPDQGIAVFAELLRSRSPQVGVIPIDWAQFPATLLQQPFFQAFQPDRATVVVGDRPAAAPDLRTHLSQIPGSNPTAQLTRFLQAEVGKVLGLPATQLPNPRSGFFDLGMDSLMTIELRNRLETALGQSIPNTVLFEYPTIADLAAYLTNTLLTAAEPSANGISMPSKTNAFLLEQSVSGAADHPPTDSEDLETAIAQELAALETLL
jgi:acyl transferase domain-containing protein/acyl carrier protein